MPQEYKFACEDLERLASEYVLPMEDRVIEDDNCPLCGKALFGLIAQLCGGFRWRIQHGVGECSACRMGIRLYHYIEHKECASGAKCEVRIVLPVMLINKTTLEVLQPIWQEWGDKDREQFHSLAQEAIKVAA